MNMLGLIVFVIEGELHSWCKTGEMASTWMMTLFLMWMEYSLSLEISEQFQIIDPLWVQLARQSDKVEDILS